MKATYEEASKVSFAVFTVANLRTLGHLAVANLNRTKLAEVGWTPRELIDEAQRRAYAALEARTQKERKETAP